MSTMLSETMETENLEAIVVQCFAYKIDEIQAMSTLRAESLAHMNRLKLLMLWNLNFSGSLNFLSNELGYIYWDKYPFTCLLSSFEPDKLVELILPRSNIRQLWEGKNFIGVVVACCITLVAHDDPTSLGYGVSPSIYD